MKKSIVVLFIFVWFSGMTFAAGTSSKSTDKSTKTTDSTAATTKATTKTTSNTTPATDKSTKTTSKSTKATDKQAKTTDKNVKAATKPTPAVQTVVSGNTLFVPGAFTAQLGVGTGFFSGVDVYGGCEYGLGTFKITPQIPLTYGVGMRLGYYGYGSSYSETYETKSYTYRYNYSNIAISVLGTLHLNWSALMPKNEFAKRIESYIGLGLGGYMYGYSYSNDYDAAYNTSSSSFRFAFTSIEGNNWYFNPHFALNIEGGYYTYYYGGRLGLLYKF